MRCGICCSATVLSGVRLEAAEGLFAEKHHLRVVETEKGSAFVLPCPLLTAKCCSVYTERPRRCRLFRCKTLRAFEDGSLTEEKSLERIDALQERIEVIQSAIATESRGALWWAAALISDPNTDSAQRAQLAVGLEEVSADLTDFRNLANDWIASPENLARWSHE